MLKSQKILGLILFSFVLILFRTWHLCVFQRDDRTKQALTPQKKMIIDKAQRGLILDRFGAVLATNKIRYDASIYYSQINQIPRFSWEKDKTGKKIKKNPRKELIENLSNKVGDILGVEPKRIEDLIYAKASLFPNTPFTLKENISEQEYYRLKMLEKDFPGLYAQICSERYYPQDKLAGEILGYMGAINSTEYLSIANKINELERYLEEEENNQMPEFPEGFYDRKQVIYQLNKLKEKAYTINDLVGKVGIEKKFEKKLRGFYGQRTYEVDINGNFTKKLPGEKKAISGRNVSLTISSELQDFAEKLLAQDEKKRIGTSKWYDRNQKKGIEQKQPWIKGGAIVAIDPNTGETLALASYPRFNPNDFIPTSDSKRRHKKTQNVSKWLENDSGIADIWEGKQPLSREFYSKETSHFYSEDINLTWPFFLDLIFPKNSLREAVDRIDTLKKAIDIQECVDSFLYFSGQKNSGYLFDTVFSKENGHISINEKIPYKEKLQIDQNLFKNREKIPLLKEKLDFFCSNIAHNNDKLFVIDIIRTLIFSPAFSDDLITQIGNTSLDSYYKIYQKVLYLQTILQKNIQNHFHQIAFIPWREKNEKSFLKSKRAEEKEKKIYPKPYIDYLDQKENEMFASFWEQNKNELLLYFIKQKKPSSENLLPYIKQQIFNPDIQNALESIQSFCQNLNDELTIELLKTIRSFSNLTRPLLGEYPQIKKGGLEKDLAKSFYPKEGFGFGRSFAFSQATPLGSIFKLVTAYSALKLSYQDNLYDLNPLTMIDTICYDKSVSKGDGLVVGYLENNRPIPRFYKGGRIPKSHSPFIGKIDLKSALEQSSNSYFSILAGDIIQNPDELLSAAKEFGFGQKTAIELTSEFKGALPKDLHTNKTGLYSFAIGQHSLLVTPLQTAMMLSSIANGGKLFKPLIVKYVFGNEPKYPIDQPFDQNNYAFKELLSLLNVDFPLFTATEYNQQKLQIIEFTPEIKNSIFLPESIRSILLQAMDLVVTGEKGTARSQSIKSLRQDPVLLKEYQQLSHQMIGKTSTAEISYNLNINPSSKQEMYKHIWFGAISFYEESPELVVVIFLRFGDGGKEAAPLASQIINKWREIKNRFHKES